MQSLKLNDFDDYLLCDYLLCDMFSSKECVLIDKYSIEITHCCFWMGRKSLNSGGSSSSE